jgi:deazaflavin-dependent oxidoreductase (nitroreductase family)
MKIQVRVAHRRPSGLAAWLLRLPVLLYRLGLGWLLGYRFAQITHRGRRSGRIYRSVVEVVRFDPATHEVVVLAAWRGRTDWYRNLEAAPALEISIGHLRFVPEQRLLIADQTLREVCSYTRDGTASPRASCRGSLASIRMHPRLWRKDR